MGHLEQQQDRHPSPISLAQATAIKDAPNISLDVIEPGGITHMGYGH
ncbi:hypothetical protein VCB98_10440 [Gammaproteobacteria bacterium AB-CW1]|uniref:Uncharacterized protein n=1 Tax=Natronospira elongata TaxID=3110268 RepID=A0AAP6JGK2_9GAMM|nr:hypothetical protein [Gammaproteobacteria bacterium AB-CW1]